MVKRAMQVTTRFCFTLDYDFLKSRLAHFNAEIVCLEQWRTQKVSEWGSKFRHNRVTSQINLRSGEGMTIIGWSGGMPRKNFAKLHLKIRIFVPVKSEASRNPKKRSHMLRNPRRTPNTCKKSALFLLKLLGFALQFFIFRV